MEGGEHLGMGCDGVRRFGTTVLAAVHAKAAEAEVHVGR
jgi:hypothetical protein